ncbi:MAG: response regulator [Lautropia sp.]
MPEARPADRGRSLPAFVPFVLAAVVLVIDLLAPRGYTEWVLYLVPVALSLPQRRPALPFAVAAVCTVLSAIGWLLSPVGTSASLSAVNRGIGLLAAWALAFVVHGALVQRATARRLLWLQRGESELSAALLGEADVGTVGRSAAGALAGYLGAQVAAVYYQDGPQLALAGTHAVDPATIPATLSLDHGVAGEVARRGTARLLDPVPAGHLPIASALGTSAPQALLIAPIQAEGRTCGIVELGFVGRLVDGNAARELLEAVGSNIGTAVQAALYRQRLVGLLEQTQRQSAELQAQQEELRVTNEELEEQARALEASQVRLETQQQSLEQTNARLEEQGDALRRQAADLQAAKTDLETTAQELAAASRYKSEFLANMSHELRTPLNSALILAKLLADNAEGTLSDEQVRYAQAIHASNNDLLTLINDILDLSKIEAGHADLVPEPVALAALLDGLRVQFEPLAAQKSLRLELATDGDAPIGLVTDRQRLQQVLKNLLANAIKFTDAGSIVLRVVADGDGVRFDVSDTGIGIPTSQHAVIFEAFRQADGSTSRRYGGTGLGLSISRELARRLGGDITVDSEPGRGSVFSLRLPTTLMVAAQPPEGAGGASVRAAAAASGGGTGPDSGSRPAGSAIAATRTAAIATAEVAASAGTGRAGAGSAAPVSADAAATAPASSTGARPPGAAATAAASGASTADGDAVRPGAPAAAASSRLILAVEDDPAFAAILAELSKELQFETVVATTAADALRLARERSPSAVLLDIGLPDASGLTVLEQLKRDPQTRHIPVHVISAHDRVRTALELGAIGYVVKPAERDQVQQAIVRLERRLQQQACRVLVVEDDPSLRENLKTLLGGEHVEVVTVGRVADAVAQLAAGSFDCIVMDLALPDGTGYDLLERLAGSEQSSLPPVIVYTGRALTRDDEQRLRRYSRSIIIKGARSPERLLDEVTLFLHRVEAMLPADQQRMLRQAARRDAVLEGRRILLAEDDVRNVFALTSVFEPLGVRLEIARNGREVLERLERLDVDLVLMDVMMPEMDGLEATRRIRARPEWQQLPIIALTAKAMPDDRDRCLAAGANDYIAKPIDIDKLISLTRVWCPK